MSPFGRHIGTLLFLILFSEQISVAARLHIVRPFRHGHYTVPTDLSADGRVLVLYSESTTPPTRALRQVWPSSAKEIPMNIPVDCTAEAISADGSIVVGWTYNAAGSTRGFRWTKETGTLDLSANPDLNFQCTAVSGDGQVVVGIIYDAGSLLRPFFWSAETSLQRLNISGYGTGFAYAANHDGNVIVGSVTATNGDTFACRWQNMGEAELLDVSLSQSRALAVTPDGSFIVGITDQPNGFIRGFYWTFWSGMQWIEAPEGYHAIVFSDLSADARRVVGHTYGADGVWSAIIWTPEAGVQHLDQVFASALPRGWHFVSADAISADGRWIVGTLARAGRTDRGYILDTGRRR